MSLSILVQERGQAPEEHELKTGRMRVGSGAACDVHIPSSEIAEASVEVELRGSAVFVRNLNDFAVILGEAELPSRVEAEWRPSEVLLLSPSVSISLRGSDHDLPSGAGEAVDANKWKRSSVQIAVIALCTVLGAYMLANEGKEKQVQKLSYSFEDIVEEIQVLAGDSPEKQASLADLTTQDKIMWKYLREARRLERRWNDEEGKKKALDAYTLLLSYGPVRSASLDAVELNPTDARQRRNRLYARVKQFASSQVLALETSMQ